MKRAERRKWIPSNPAEDARQALLKQREQALT
jgi:hypothetical protein